MSLGIKPKAKKITQKGEDLTNVVAKTMKLLSNMVGVTLGPGGNTVLIERTGFPPLTTKDGVTVAESISLEDATEHVVAEAAKEACQRTNKQAGDGTTTAIVLADAIIEEGMSFLRNNVLKSPQELCRELRNVISTVVDELKAMATPVSSKQDIFNVAMISSNSDEDVATAVVEAVDLVGQDGTIVTEEGKSRNTLVELREGFTVNKGLSCLGTSQEIFINNPADQECVLELPYILLYDGNIMTPQTFGIFLGNCFMKMKEEGSIRPVVVMAHKFSPAVVRMIAENIRMGTANLCLIETAATGQPNSKHHLLHDLAAFTSAEVLDPVTHDFDKGSLDDLGVCSKVRIGRYRSIFFDSDDPELVEARIEVLKGQKVNAESDYDAEIIQERISRLSGGIASIFVGGSTELEMLEKKHRIEDTINAVRSAIELGVIPGGGSALMKQADNLRKAGNPSAQILAAALSRPFIKILENAGESGEEIGRIASRVLDGELTEIYDSLHHQFVSPIEAGIVDPVKVTIAALENAMSIASMLMTIGGTVVIPRDTSEEAGAEMAAQNFAKQMQGT